MKEKISQYVGLMPNDVKDEIVISCIASIYVDFAKEIVCDEKERIDLKDYARIISTYMSSGAKGVHTTIQ